MVKSYYTDIPATIMIGASSNGRHILFVNGGVYDLTESELEEHSDSKFAGFNERIVVDEVTAVNVVSAISDEMILALNEKDCESLIATFDDKLEGWRILRSRQVSAYDSSGHVNSCVFYGQSLWLNQATRNGLIQRLNAEKALGHTSTTLWYGNMSFDLDIELAYTLIYSLEVYASQCYDVTASHLATIEKAETIDELIGFDYTSNYPDKLTFLPANE